MNVFRVREMKGDEIEREKDGTQKKLKEQQHLDWKTKSGLRPPLRYKQAYILLRQLPD